MAKVAGTGFGEPSGFQRHGKPREAAGVPCILGPSWRERGSSGQVTSASVSADPLPFSPALWLDF